MSTRREHISAANLRLVRKLNELYDLIVPRVASYRCSTAQNLNITAGMTVAWNNTNVRRQDTGISINGANTLVTVAGRPNYIDINVNIKIGIADTDNKQRPNQVVRLVRSDGKVLASSATGYIRDTGDHEESSYNFTVTDAFPIENANYRVTAIRESNNIGSVPLDIDETQLDFKVFN